MIEDISTIRAAVERIERALLGDEAMGNDGLVKKVRSHDKRIFVVERALVWGSGVIAVLATGYKIATDWLR